MCLGEGCAEALRARLLVSLRERIRLHQLGGLVNHVVLTVVARAANPRLAPEVMVFVDAHVSLGRALELDAGRGGSNLVDVEAAGLFCSQLP